MRTTIGSILAGVALFLLLAANAGAASDDFAQQVLVELNLARTQPRQYAEFLRELRGRFQGKGYRLPGSNVLVITAEGVPAVDEAIGFLVKQPPLPPLSWSPGLAEAAAELVRDEGRTGDVGHRGTSGDMRERIERHGRWRSRIAENIGYGPDTARLMVMELIIDDGVPQRGPRKNIFTRALSVAGAACGPHPHFRTMCVIDFAGGFKDKDG